MPIPLSLDLLIALVLYQSTDAKTCCASLPHYRLGKHLVSSQPPFFLLSRREIIVHSVFGDRGRGVERRGKRQAQGC
jgi:hypothetical protein